MGAGWRGPGVSGPGAIGACDCGAGRPCWSRVEGPPCHECPAPRTSPTGACPIAAAPALCRCAGPGAGSSAGAENERGGWAVEAACGAASAADCPECQGCSGARCAPCSFGWDGSGCSNPDEWVAGGACKLCDAPRLASGPSAATNGWPASAAAWCGISAAAPATADLTWSAGEAVLSEGKRCRPRVSDASAATEGASEPGIRG